MDCITDTPDEIWMVVGDESRDITVKVVALPGFNRSALLESFGKVVLFKHVYVLNDKFLFYDDMASISSSYIVSPPNTDQLLEHFKSSEL
jgi:hypothetical protein